MKFLQSPTGLRLLEVLVTQCPGPMSGGAVDSPEIRIGRIHGYQRCYATMIGLSSVETGKDLLTSGSVLQQALDELDSTP